MRYAILISCEEYTNYSDVFYAFADAEEIISTLTGYCDYNLENILSIQLYPGCGENPTSIYQSIEIFFSKMKIEDTLLFYFAGHGHKAGEKGYLLLPESTFENLPDTAIDIRELNEKFQKIGCNCFLLLDACHSGMQARTVIKSDSLLETIPKDTGCVTIAACSANEESYPDTNFEHGAFTYFLCEEIKKTPNNNDVLPEMLKLSVCRDVTDWAKRNSKVQTPTLIGQVVGNVSIATRNDKEYDNTQGVIEDETLTLMEEIVSDWMIENYCISATKPVKINKDWRIFGRLKVFEAISENKSNQWLVLFTIAEKFNHANMIHTFSNMLEIRDYYKRFGKESKYEYLQLIILKNKEACGLVERLLLYDKAVHRKWRNTDVHSIILYLNRGKLIEYKNNGSMPPPAC